MKRGGPIPRRARLKPRSRTKRPPPGRDNAYRAWIRDHPCLLYRPGQTSTCETRPPRRSIEAAHVQTWGSSRRDHGNLVPLCPKHHDEQEGRTREFEAWYTVDLAAEAVRLGQEWEELVA